mgnify:CR=1 FL=1
MQQIPSLLTFEEDFYQNLKRQGKSLNTLKNYKTDIPCFKKFLIAKNSVDHLNNFNEGLVGEYHQFLNQKYNSDNSKRRRIQALRLFFDFLMAKEIIGDNPVKKLPSAPKFLDIPRPTSYDHLQKLWDGIVKGSKSEKPLEQLMYHRGKVLFLLIFDCGLKVSDLAKLKLSQLSLGTKARVLVTPLKRDPYSIPLGPYTVEVIKEYIELLDAQKERDHQEFSELLFNGNPFHIISGGISPRGVEIMFEDYRRKYDVVATPKSLRQSCVFKWLHLGRSDSLIKEWLGVAPSYSLKLYKSHMDSHVINDYFLTK